MSETSQAFRDVPDENPRLLRMSVLTGVLALVDYVEANPGTSQESALQVLGNHFAASALLDLHLATRLIEGISLQLLVEVPTRDARLRLLVRHYIRSFHPAWARLIPKGRNFVEAYLSPNEVQCFVAATLLGSEISIDCRNWWTELDVEFRALANFERLQRGHEAEERTMEFERARLVAAGHPELIPTWVGLDDNTLGYDVRSYSITDTGIKPRNIEVKSTAFLPPSFHLSRNQWDRAVENVGQHCLYVWNASQSIPLMIWPDALASHIPDDNGNGKWSDVVITWTD